MRNATIQTYAPQDQDLAKYIHFYYEHELVNEAYFAFPSDKNVVAAFEKTKVNYSDNNLYLIQEELQKNSFYGLKKFQSPLFIKTNGSIREFVVIFKPYGLAQFMHDDRFDNAFFPITQFNLLLEKHVFFFDYPIEKKITIFEQFALLYLRERPGLDIIQKSLDLLQKEDISIDEIARKCNCSYKKLYRLYKTHCGVTPMAMKKTMRFRNILKKIKNKKKGSRLSDIAIDFGYYDQAIFNKAFKQLTGESPKKFFKTVSILSEKDMYFKS